MNNTTIPEYVKILSPGIELEWLEPPKRNTLPDEIEEGYWGDEDCSYEELNFDDEV
jgi:hypothetical protein